jgi:GTPase SAR1 family protein
MSKRIIITVGDARVGKSTVIKLLLEMLAQQGKRIKVYNQELFPVFKAYEQLATIKKFDLSNDDADAITDDLNHPELDVMIVDMPGQDIEKVIQYIESASLFEVVVKFGWNLTFLQPISHREDCIYYLNAIIQNATNNANYVVVKNYHFAPEFREYEKKIRKKLLIIGGTEVELTALHRNHYQAMEKTDKPYSQVCQDLSIILFWRSFIFQWIKKFRHSVMNNKLAIKYLGLD